MTTYDPRYRQLDPTPEAHAPTTSWWLDMTTREAFDAALARERTRQRHGRQSALLSGRDAGGRRHYREQR